MNVRTSLELGGEGLGACGDKRTKPCWRPGQTRAGVLFFFVTMALHSAAAQQSYGDPVEGGQLARTWCSGCHRVEAGTAGPANDAAPSFSSIAHMPSTTTLSITAFLRTSHPPMPDLRLTEAEIADVSAYILSLRRR
jgi:mono/diheme cytochrome c family protein